MKLRKILSMLLAIMMAFSLFNVIAFAEGAAEAQIGSNEYATLEAAVAAAQDGNTIVLLADITKDESYSVPVWGKGFNIDLNGHTFTTNSNQSITLSDGGYKATAICFGDETNVPNPTRDISLSNGTIRTAYGAGVYADGQNLTMTLSDLDVKQNYPANVQSTDEYSTAVRLTGNATVIIESGRYEGKHAIVVSNSGGSVIVNGGTFVGDIFIAPTTSAGAVKSVTIYGGTFDHDPTDYVADGYKAVNNGDGTWTVESRYVAQIGNVKYETLSAAVAALEDGDTIELLADIDFSTGAYVDYKWAGSTYNPLTITKNNVTLDLAGHTISNMGNAAIVLGNLLAVDGRIANVTVKNGTLLAGETGGVTNSYVLGIAGVDGALIKNVTTNGGINAYSASKDIVIDSCNVNGTKYYTVCAQVGSDITIKGTTYTKNTDSSVATKAMFWVDGAGTESDIKTSENPTGAFDASSITIESGDFTVSFAEGGNFHLASGLKPVVKGGTFNFDPSAYVADGYKAVNNGNGTWTVVDNNVAEVNGVKYATLADAVAAASEGDTIKLIADITYGTDKEVEVWEKAVNLDLDGHTLTTNSTVSTSLGNNGYKASAICYSIGGSEVKYVTVSNGTIVTAYGAGIYADGTGLELTLTNLNVRAATVGTQSTKEYSSAVRITGQAKVIINGGSYSGYNAVAVSNSGGEYVINDGQFTGNLFISSNGNTKKTITITGGTFNSNPTAYVADGYEAVQLDNGKYQVGEVKAADITETAANTGYDATFTASKQVVSTDGNNDVLNESNTITVNVKAVTEDTAASNTTVDKVKIAEILDQVIQVAPKTASEINVDIKIVCDNPEVVNNTITYEVHPEAVITVDNDVVNTVAIDNSSLKSGASFRITLPVPAELAVNGRVKVTHISEEFGSEVQSYSVDGDAQSGYSVTFDVTHFSQFELAIDELTSYGTATLGMSLSLEDSIDINFYIGNLKNAYGYNETDPGRFKVVYTYKGVTKSKTLTSQDNNKIVVASCAAKELTEVVTIKLYYDDICFGSFNYSAQKYCDDKITENSNEKLVKLCYALLEYGSYAQHRFDYKTGDLASNNHYSNNSQSVEKPDGYYLVAGDFSGSYYIVDQLGISLSLESKTEINVYFKPVSDPGNYTVKVNGTKKNIITTHDANGVNSRVTIPGIAAKDLGTKVNIEISNGDDSFTFKYSPMTYAVMSWDSTQDGNVSKALYCYYLAADAYFAS